MPSLMFPELVSQCEKETGLFAPSVRFWAAILLTVTSMLIAAGVQG